MTDLPPMQPPPTEPAPPFEPLPPSAGGPADWIPITALVLGCVNLLSWCLPICGCPLGIGGIVLGVIGLKSTKYKNLAMIGLILSALSMLATLANGVLGVYLRLKAQGG